MLDGTFVSQANSYRPAVAGGNEALVACLADELQHEIERLGLKSLQLTKDIYSGLSPWQITKIARHQDRPYTLDYVNAIFTHFQELHGDRHFSDDLSIVGGLARFNGQPCMVLGHQKGRDTK